MEESSADLSLIGEVEKLRSIVCKGLSAKYKGVRPYTPWYGGSTSLDIVGCFGHCPPCWTYKSNTEPERFGRFYLPEQVVSAIPPQSRLVRISAGEPTLNFPHLVRVLELLPKDKLFLLETNGVLLDKEEVRQLSQFPNLHVRLSLKGVDEPTSQLYFGWAIFSRQMALVGLLRAYGISFHCCIIDLFPKDKIKDLVPLVGGNPKIIKGMLVGTLEIEHYKEYPFTRLKVQQFRKKLSELIS